MLALHQRREFPVLVDVVVGKEEEEVGAQEEECQDRVEGGRISFLFHLPFHSCTDRQTDRMI